MAVIYDECHKFDITTLAKNGYLKPNQVSSGIMTWSRGEGVYKTITSRIGFTVDTLRSPFVKLNYTYNGKDVSYHVRLESIPSNLGKGVIWFFICPVTGKRCRILYCSGNYFLHRDAYSGGMYDKQSKSHKQRDFETVFGSIFRRDDVRKEIYRKHFRSHYNGKPTKRYMKLQNHIDRAVTMSEVAIRTYLKNVID